MVEAEGWDVCQRYHFALSRECGSRHVSDKETNKAWSLSACTTLDRAYTCDDGVLDDQSARRTSNS